MASASVESPPAYGWSSSGYVTCASLSDEERNGEEDLYSKGSERDRFHHAICPHCNFVYEKPVTLQCGHSLCERCCTELLSRMPPTTSIPRKVPRMGISMLGRSLTPNVFSSWRSPRCVVCGEAPKKIAPVPNLTLRGLLPTIRLPPGMRQWQRRETKENASESRIAHNLSESLTHPLPSYCELSRVSIRDCFVSIVGSKGAGKSCLLQTQLCNDMMIDVLLGREETTIYPQSPNSEIGFARNDERERRGATYMLKLEEKGDLSEKISLSMGVAVVYSVVDRESFHDAHRLLSIFTTARGAEMPMVLIGTKSDLEKRRQVESYEGQSIAKQFNCPFIEVSSRRNENVNEAFVELVRVMESRNLLK